MNVVLRKHTENVVQRILLATHVLTRPWASSRDFSRVKVHQYLSGKYSATSVRNLWVRPNETIFHQTSIRLSMTSIGRKIVLYAGNPAQPNLPTHFKSYFYVHEIHSLSSKVRKNAEDVYWGLLKIINHGMFKVHVCSSREIIPKYLDNYLR